MIYVYSMTFVISLMISWALNVFRNAPWSFLFVFLSVLLVYVASGYVSCPSFFCDVLVTYSAFLFLYFLALIGDDLP